MLGRLSHLSRIAISTETGARAMIAVMKSHTEYLWFNTRKHREFINITHKVEEALRGKRH